MSRREHFEHGGAEHAEPQFRDQHDRPLWQAPSPTPVDYDEHLPEPSRPGMVEFGGRQLPASSFHKGEHSLNFTTPLENGAIAHVMYFPRSRQANAAMMHARANDNGGVTMSQVGAYDEHGRSAGDDGASIQKWHGGDKTNLPLTPTETVETLQRWSQIEQPDYVRRDNQQNLSRLQQSWGWKP